MDKDAKEKRQESGTRQGRLSVGESVGRGVGREGNASRDRLGHRQAVVGIVVE